MDENEIDLFCDTDDPFLAEIESLSAEAKELWERNQNTPEFQGFVSADYVAVYHSLLQLRGRVSTFLEWGSGLGVVTIIASRLGFEAYGIEVEPLLVDYSEKLAEAYGADARFTPGSFIPDEFEWDSADVSEVDRTIIDTPAGYDELEMELHDFDLVYAYPWPDEHGLFHTIMREFGARHSLFLSYDAREGVQLIRPHDDEF